jgi:hypothetical protein
MMEPAASETKSMAGGCLPVLKTVSCGALAVIAVFLLGQSYLFSPVADWQAAPADPDLVLAVMVVMILAFACATAAAAIMWQYRTTWVIYGIFLLILGVRFIQVLPYCQG